jgi:YVTN family beta-propeller protein
MHDPASGDIRATIKAGKRPWGIGLSPDGKNAFVANGPSNDVSVIDVEQRREVQKIPVGDGPWGLTVVPAATAVSDR